jgi:CheY-like chemotaxis protein
MQQVSKATSELNNLLQIISGTSELLENIWEGNAGAEKYFGMLRHSVERAAQVTALLVEQAGGGDSKIVLHPDVAAFARTPVPSRPVESRPSILVVDDEPLALQLARSILTEAGFRVVTAQSGFECLDLFSRHPGEFHLVILDLTMPFMDGEETLGRLRQFDAQVPIFLNTGFVHEEHLDRMMAAGLTGLLPKPQAPSDYVASVRTVLQSVAAREINSPGGTAIAV